MSEQLLDDLNVDAGGEMKCGREMPEVVQSDRRQPGQVGDLLEQVGHESRVQRLTCLGGELEARPCPVLTRGVPFLARFLTHPDPGHAVNPDRLAALTDREREILSLVAAGMTNDEIAARLVLSPATAKTHVNRAMVKLGARDRAQLAVIAYSSGLVRPPIS